MIILQAFNFNDEHLYQFSYIDSFGAPQIIAHPACEEDLYTDEIRIEDIDILRGDLIKFHYDFGDDWKFQIQIEKIDSTLNIKNSIIIEKAGRAPKQYAYY